MPRDVNRRDQRYRRSELRAEMTAPETLLWSRLRGGQLNGLKFRRQYGVGPFIVDFYCPRSLLAIEVDGDSHFESDEAEERDRQRSAYIQGEGISILRFTNHEVATSLDAVAEAIYQRAAELSDHGGRWWPDREEEGEGVP